MVVHSRLFIQAPFSLRRFASKGSADLDLELARQWLKSLDSKTIPRHIAQISFSRSSGPGGQNVNKSVQFRSSKSPNVQN